MNTPRDQQGITGGSQQDWPEDLSADALIAWLRNVQLEPAQYSRALDEYDRRVSFARESLD